MVFTTPPINRIDGWNAVLTTTPFTTRDGDTYLHILRRLHKYINNDIVAHLENLDELIILEINKISDSVHSEILRVEAIVDDFKTEFVADKAAFLADVETRLADAISQVVNSSIILNDSLIAAVLANPESETAVAASNLFERKNRYVVRDRRGAEEDDHEAFVEALAGVTAGGVVVWASDRKPVLRGGYNLTASTIVDFNGNRVKHTENMPLFTYQDDAGLSGIGETTGGLHNVSIEAVGAAKAGNNATGIQISDCWGFEFRNVELFNYQNGVGIWLRNYDDIWTEGTLFDNVMINACKTALKLSSEGDTTKEYSSFAYTNIQSLSINVPVGGTAVEMVSTSTSRVWLYNSVLNITLWMRNNSVGFKTNHRLMAHKNRAFIRSEGQDDLTACKMFVTVAGAQFTATGSIVTISEAAIKMHEGAGRVCISGVSADTTYDSENTTIGGIKYAITNRLEVDVQSNADRKGATGYQVGHGIDRAFAAGYDGGEDVYAVYGIPYETPKPSGWKKFLGIASGLLRVGDKSGNVVTISHGVGSPETVLTAPVGSLYLNRSGGATTTLWVKTSGNGNTGWMAK